MNTSSKVNSLTRLEIKPKFTAPEADTLTTRPSELSIEQFANYDVNHRNYKENKFLIQNRKQNLKLASHTDGVTRMWVPSLLR